MKFYKIVLAGLLILVQACLFAQMQQLSVRPLSDSDDAEQRISTGAVDVRSSDLELGGYDRTVAQMVGIRFPNVTLPTNVTIESAYIQFSVDAIDDDGAEVTIRAQLGGALAYAQTSNNISSRPYTASSVVWNAPAWPSVGDRGAAQRTADLSALIQEAIQFGFSPGDALAFTFSAAVRQGKVEAESFDSGPSSAPELIIIYSEGIVNPPSISPTGNVVFNEINYRSVNIQEDIDFVELYNADSSIVDLSGWKITDGISYTIPNGTLLYPGRYLVIAADLGQVQSTFGVNGAIGPFTGGLSGGGDELILRDASFEIVDEVPYDSWGEWPSVRFIDDGDSPASIQKINPNLKSRFGGSWSAASPTPGLANNQVFLANAEQLPVVKSISKSIDNPTSGQEVEVLVELSNLDGLTDILSVVLEYQAVVAGSYIHKSDAEYASNWLSIPMQGDLAVGDYSAIIPASVQVNRSLIRYRIVVSTSSGYEKTFPDQNHIESNYAYYVYDGYPLVGNFDINSLDPQQEVTVITGNSTADRYIGPGNGTNNRGQYSGKDFLGEGTIVYNGVVYDHVRFRPRGRTGGREDRYKPGIKFDMNKVHAITPLMDCGGEYEEVRGKFVLSGGYVSDIATHGFTESLIHKILDLMGGMARGTEYAQFRIVDETSAADDFWGLFLIVEDYDQEYLEENGYPVGNIWRHKSGRLSSQGDFPNSDNIGDWPEDESLIDWDLTLADKAANFFLGNGARNYEGKHSQRDYYNSVTGKWHTWYGDYDTAFGISNDDATYSPREDSKLDIGVDLVQNLDGQEEEFKNVMRSAYDLLFNQEQINYLIDVEASKIRKPSAPYDWTTVDRARWNQEYDLGNVDAQIDWYRGWFASRSAYLLNQDEKGFASSGIPDKPVIALTGSTALDDLTFSTSAFQGAGGFSRLEWRVGEWSDPSNPLYQGDCIPKFEIDAVWESGELSTFSNTFSIPGDANLELGKTYKIRVRYKDNAGKWSHWSDAVQVVPSEVIDNTAPSLVINEIMYNPSEKCGSEFLEIKNNESTAISLDGYAFSNGVEYTFPEGSSIAAGGFLVLARDSTTFLQKYGFSPFGDYSGSLDNKGEELVLSGLFGRLVDIVEYADKEPWEDKADGEGYSLVLRDSGDDNTEASNWCRSDSKCGSPGAENIPVCANFVNPQVFEDYGINITGVGYNILDETGNDNDNLEFLFITNFGDEDRLVAGDSIFSGISFEFPSGSIIPAGETVMLTKDLTKYTGLQYTKFLWTEGKLSNGGERIAYRNAAGDLINDFTYDDKTPWPEEADGDGFYLQLLGDDLDNVQAENWEAVRVPVDPCSALGGDADGDGVCAAEDCDDTNAAISSEGDACDDLDATTENDVVQADCSCAGTLIVTYDCPVVEANYGDACDDLDATTENDVVQADCSCAGTLIVTYDCPVVEANYGDACDDLDATTENDVVQADCSCAGTLIVTYDCPIVEANYGDACDDLDATTENDVVQTDCSCAGTQIVTYDCPVVQANYGDACDDLDATTENDVVQTDCSCAGTQIVTYDCPVVQANYGDACDDLDASTENDVIQTDCSCAGTPIQTGGCQAAYSVNGFTLSVQNLDAPITAVKVLDAAYNELFVCNDFTVSCGNPEVITLPAIGSYFIQIQTFEDWSTPVCNIFEGFEVTGVDPCATLGGDSDNDGICDDNDPCDNNLAGTSCDDFDATTENDVYDNNCNCAGTPIVQPDCPVLGANFGDACDDLDASTENDVVQTDCSCAGTPIQTGGCQATYSVSGFTLSVQNLDAPITAVKVLDAAYNELFVCNDFTVSCGNPEVITLPAIGSYFIQIQTFEDWSTPVCNIFEGFEVSGVDPCAALGGDSDNDGICDDNDPCDNNLAGTSCDDFDATTENDVYDNNCNCAGTPIAQPDCPTIGANFGDACDDLNATTFNDAVQPDCSCAGTTPPAGVDLELSASSAQSTVAIYTANAVTVTLTNTGGQAATGIEVFVPKPEDVVYTGGNEYTASQGALDIFGSTPGVWSVGTLAAGESATIVVNYFSLSATGYAQYGEVLGLNEQDVDSNPGNGSGLGANEDDEFYLDLSTNQVLGLNIDFYPNPVPAGEQIVLKYMSSGEVITPLLVSDLNGRVIFRTKVEFAEGFNEVPVSIGDLPSGVYIIALSDTGLQPTRLIVR